MKKKNSFGSVAGRIWSQYSFIFVLIIIMIAHSFTISANGNTFKWSHIAAILGSQNTCIVGTMALGMAFVIITGQIDLSIGSALVLCTGVTIMTFNVTNSIPLMILAALASGALCGAVNGVLVGCAKMPPFVVTLGTMLIYRSLTLSVVRSIDPAISGSSSSQFAMISDNSNYEFLRMKFGTGKLALGSFSIPYITFVFVLMVIIFVIIANRTKYGKSVYAVGSNEQAARLSGIKVTRVKFFIFMLSGFCAALAGVVMASRLQLGSPVLTSAYEMDAIAAVCIGGTSSGGGDGSLGKTVCGALALTVIRVGLNILRISTSIQQIVIGAVIVAAVAIDMYGRNRQK